MNTDTNDGRPEALQRADDGAQAWRAVARSQRITTPDHGDIYALMSEVAETLRSLSALASILTLQVATYGRERTLRDDEPGHDPAERLAIASSWAAQLQHDLDRAEHSANRFWDEVGHVGLEDPA